MTSELLRLLLKPSSDAIPVPTVQRSCLAHVNCARSPHNIAIREPAAAVVRGGDGSAQERDDCCSAIRGTLMTAPSPGPRPVKTIKASAGGIWAGASSRTACRCRPSKGDSRRQYPYVFGVHYAVDVPEPGEPESVGRDARAEGILEECSTRNKRYAALVSHVHPAGSIIALDTNVWHHDNLRLPHALSNKRAPPSRPAPRFAF
jgi:hypothetical protein